MIISKENIAIIRVYGIQFWKGTTTLEIIIEV